jgi:hypothetical protein
MKCSNPDCNRGIGLVAYQRGWFSKRRYCSKHCRDAFAADAPKCGGLNGSTQHLILIRQHGVDDAPEVFSRLHCGREDGTLGSLTAGRVTECDWASVW